MRIPPTPPPVSSNALARLFADEASLKAASKAIARFGEGRYAHWDKVRFWQPPQSVTKEELWALVKMGRGMGNRRALAFAGKDNSKFHFIQTSHFLRALHTVDSNARGAIGVPGVASAKEDRNSYLQHSLIEEPFSSSVLEGAATTREIAKRMIEEGRAPKTTDERMVLNNFHAMAFIREHRNEPMSVDKILELHRILTEGTLDRPEKCGVFRSPDDDVRVVDSLTDETLHTPPPADELRKRVARLCEFANEDSDKGDFLHPVIRAVIIHFMLAYDHPFWDGNGRCARALFYWCVLRHGYWLLEYVSISSVLRKSPKQYGMAFLYTETDDNDVTYFIDHQLRVIETAVRDLHVYLDRKAKELKEIAHAFGKLEKELNRRQLQIMQDALKRPHARYEIAAHEKLHGVSYLTARSDLEVLAERGLLLKRKAGVKSVFLVPKNLQGKLGTGAAA